MPWVITTSNNNPRNASNYARHRQVEELDKIIENEGDYITQSVINPGQSTKRLTYLLNLELTRSGGAVIDQRARPRFDKP